MKALLLRLANWIANEPVATLTLFVAGGVTWLFSNFSFLPPMSDTARNTIVTLVVGLVGLIARQYVVPVRKLAPPAASPVVEPAPVAPAVDPSVPPVA